MTVDLVLPNKKVIKQEISYYQSSRALNDYTANTSNSNCPDRWWEREPRTVYAMMSAAPNMSHVGSEKF